MPQKAHHSNTKQQQIWVRIKACKKPTSHRITFSTEITINRNFYGVSYASSTLYRVLLCEYIHTRKTRW